MSPMPSRPSRATPWLLALAALLPLSSQAADTVARFEGGIGVTPWAMVNVGGVPTPVLNTVFTVDPGGRPWAISALRARVSSQGELQLRGSRLVFAGGNATGTAGPVTQVMATLFCAGVAHDTPAFALEPNGDFSFRGMLLSPPPTVCTNPVLLVRNAAGTRAWFAAGLPVTGED